MQSLFQTDNGRNGDLGHVLAWWLAQPLSEGPTTTQELATTLRTKVSFEGLEWRSSKGKQITVNEARARQAALWLSYLGLGWEHGDSAATSSNIQPDPSTYLRSQFHRHLPKNGAGARVSEIWQSISEESPFLEGGRYAQNLERAGLLQDRGNSFTQSVSLALRRLHEEGSIQLIEQSDAASRHLRILTWGSGSHDRITHIARGPKSAG